MTGPPGRVRIECSRPILALGLAEILGIEARGRHGHEPPAGEAPSAVVVCPEGPEPAAEGVVSEVRRARRSFPDAAVLLFLDSSPEPPLARAALRAGARGFVHAGMPLPQIVGAGSVAVGGETAIPRDLLEDIATKGPPADPGRLTPRQRKILELAAGGLTNARIAGRLSLSEAAVKRHPRDARETLGLRDRADAAKLFGGGRRRGPG